MEPTYTGRKEIRREGHVYSIEVTVCAWPSQTPTLCDWEGSSPDPTPEAEAVTKG
jgi:hypothetical protein